MSSGLIHKEDTLLDKKDRKIRFSSFIPQKTKIQLVLVHGFSEHKRRYYDVAEKLCQKGVAVHLMDLPGHGLSDGPRGHIDDFQDYLDNVHLFFHAYPHFLKTKPTFLLGHSLGGLIASQYCLQRNPQIKGLILCSPLTGFCSLMSVASTILSKIIARKNPAYLIPKPSGVATLSRNPQKWPQYHNDPYRLRTISPNLYLSMLQQTRLLQNRASELNIPLLLFYTVKDQVVSAAAISRFFNNASSRDKTAVVFTEAMHELFQEVEREKVLEKMWAWMNERV
ncbi:MAG: alpha/beta hydrolase [SAR324 cluster bacterium]|nr:alpha/beta hydrolase [SAR324 cluster bacterium]